MQNTKVTLRSSGVVKVRTLFRFVGVGVPYVYGCHNNSVKNVVRGLNERVFNSVQNGELRPTPQALPGVFEDRLSFFRSALLARLPVLLPLSDLEFVSRYSGRRRQVYEQAAKEALLRGVNENDARLKTFVKCEKLNLTLKADPAPRLINPRSPVYNLALGKMIAHCEKPLFKAISGVYGGTTVFKGLNALEQGTELKKIWDEFVDPVAVGLDASRFDQHVGVQALAWEHSNWLRMVPQSCRRELSKLLSWQLHNRGVAYCADGKVEYDVHGCRMSGDMNTSSGNCMLMCGLVHAYCRHARVQKFRLANNGDDCVVFMERASLAMFQLGLKAWFLEMGFTMKVEDPVYTFERIEFCQTQPVLTSKGWVMVRNPFVSTGKDLTANCDIRQTKVCLRWMAAVRAGGSALTDGVPVLPQFYSMFRSSQVYDEGSQQLKPLTTSGFWRLSSGMKNVGSAVTPQARLSFFCAFGILPDEQVSLEARYSSLTLVPGSRGVLAHPDDYNVTIMHLGPSRARPL